MRIINDTRYIDGDKKKVAKGTGNILRKVTVHLSEVCKGNHASDFYVLLPRRGFSATLKTLAPNYK